eukprot:15141333-Ditylum_brightwellii.AAC.1
MLPLSYLIQTHDEPEPDMYLAPYDTLEEYLIHCMLHKDRWYVIGNKSLWIILKELTVDGPVWSFIKQFDKASNGRQ